MPSNSPKVVITGTGRAGTTLLVQVLTELGLDTGFKPGTPIDEDARAGLERGILAPGSPRIVKNPGLSTRLGGMLEQGLVAVEHVIVPMRDLDVAAASRIRVSDYGRSLGTWGGLWGTTRSARQRAVLAETFYELAYTLARFDLPHTFLLFPRFAEDAEYLHAKLSFLAPSRTVDDFRAALDRCVRPDLIHEAPLSADERRRTRWGTIYGYVVTKPRGAARRLVRRARERVPTGRAGG